ncbi:conserved hypothetical protein [Ricinus communis]|uniref:Uncharacterized protein n=1 Tax=Ricinus communis TaxID=3988 RepID=B9T1V0_RICCO|nr:conserved hypothetical protein [Ricinus communis]
MGQNANTHQPLGNGLCIALPLDFGRNEDGTFFFSLLLSGAWKGRVLSIKTSNQL